MENKLMLLRSLYYQMLNGEEMPTVTNEQGGKQSAVNVDLTLLPPIGVAIVGQILTTGARKYGRDNWVNIPVEDHVNHAMVHIMAWLSNRCDCHHLHHAATRLLFAVEVLALDNLQNLNSPDENDNDTN